MYRKVILSLMISAAVFFAGNTIVGDLQVTPEEDFISSGQPAGPFTPSFKDEENNNVNLTVELSNGIWVTPDSYDVNLTEGTTLPDTMTIGNDGSSTLDYQIRTRFLGYSETSTERINKIAAAESEGRIFSVPTEHDLTIAADVPYIQGELLVRFDEPHDASKLDILEKSSILESVGGGTVIQDFQIVPGLSLVELPAGTTVEQALEQFNNTEGILYAQPNYEVHICSKLPNDTRFNELWGMHNTGQSGGVVDADIDAPEAWDIATGSNDIVVAVIDTGVDYTHPDLAQNMWVNEGEIPGNGIDDDGNGYIDDVYGYDFRNDDGNPMDDHYHGTHCAGTIGAIGNNNQGVVGVCWTVKIMAIKFLSSGGSGTTADAIASVEYSILMGANLSSNSWGGSGYSQALKDAIDAAGAAGMLFISSAGNDGSNNDTYPHYPSSFDCESLIAVLSTDRYDNKSSFSNYGPISVDLGAPGSDILSCEPGNQYQYLSGTSMATPHVAGACALIWSINPLMSNSEVKDIILSTVDEISSLNGKCVSNGRLNLYQATLETKVPWLIIEPEEGTVEPNQTDEISVTFDANELLPGTYNAEIIILSNDSYNPEITVPVTMTVTPDALQASPEDDFEVTGPRGGPFEPNCMSYTLTNIGTEDVNWAAYNSQSWLLINPSFGLLEPNETMDVNVCFSPDVYLLDPNIYQDTVFFENLDSGCIRRRKVILTVEPPDTFSELFDGDNDLTGLMLTFMPDGSTAYYEACRQKITEFPTDPNGGTNIALWDDDYAEIILSDDNEVLFYGNWYDRLYIGSNGYITFDEGDTEYEVSLEHHFSMPRIAGLFTDLNPSSEQNISYKQLDDRIVITYKDVPLYGDKNTKNSFQIELYFVNGKIRIAWLDTDTTASITGLSEGYGMHPVLFKQSDLSKYPACWPLGDFNKNYIVNFWDFSAFAACWLETDCTIPYWCGKSDLDFSSAVNGDDFLLFIENWLFENFWWLEPVSHWKFDEGQGDIAYDSAGNNDGTLEGDTNWVGGKIGDFALNFDGNGDYVSLGDLDTIVGSNPFTICAWIYPEALGGTNKDIISKTKGFHTYDNQFGLGISSGRKLQGAFSDGLISNYLVSNGTIYLEGWSFVAFSWDGTTDPNSMKLYVDGIFDNSMQSKCSTIIDIDYPAFIGACSAAGSPSNYFDGIIDDVRIYDRALTNEEIWLLYREGLGNKASNPHPEDGAVLVDPNVVLSWTPGKDAVWHDVYFGTDFNDVNDATPDSNEYQGRFSTNNWDPCGLDFNSTYYWRIDEITNPNIYKGDIWTFTTSGPISHPHNWWKFDEGEGDTAYDSAGDYDGTLEGDTSWIGGKIGDFALNFDGNGDYVSLGDVDTIVGSNPFTICAWIYPEMIGGSNKDIISKTKGAHPYDNQFGLGISSEGKLQGAFSNGSISNYLVSNGTIPLEGWSFVTFSWDGTTGFDSMKLYVDGILDSSMQSKCSTIINIDYPAFIGACSVAGSPLNYFDGIIDDVRIYNLALSDEEIWQLYQEGLGD